MKPANETGIAVMRSITIAPWEYPPSTTLVLGQFAIVDVTCAFASLVPALVDATKSSEAG